MFCSFGFDLKSTLYIYIYIYLFYFIFFSEVIFVCQAKRSRLVDMTSSNSRFVEAKGWSL